MPRWLFALLLLLQTHFVASFLVPLDAEAQRTFGGLLRWAWPWSDGDSGPLGEVTTSSGVPLPGLMIAMAAGLALVLAILALFDVLIPNGWWYWLTIVGAALSLILMVLFPGLTKLIPIAVALYVIWFTVNHWSAGAWSPAASG